MKKTTLFLENIKCKGCAHTIAKTLQKSVSVISARVDVTINSVTLVYEGDDKSLKRLKKKLSNLGYPEKGNNSPVTKAVSYVSCAAGKTSMLLNK
jgi:copper chaperone CopZ